MKIKIMLAEDHAIMRAGLRSLLKDQPDMEIIGEAENGVCAVELADTLCPDVIIMDVTMPDMNGIEATRQITAKHPDIKIVALSAFESPGFVLGMLKAGATAYLLKDDLFDGLLPQESTRQFECYRPLVLFASFKGMPETGSQCCLTLKELDCCLQSTCVCWVRIG
jgi:CheY-like chemotaxis protein